VSLRDRTGKDRLRLSVDADNEPHLEFLDEKGAVTQRIPE
jgi:hypothetical protein